MNKQEILNYLTEHKAEFENRFGISLTALFGSFARNEAREESDIDLLIRYVSNSKDAYANN